MQLHSPTQSSLATSHVPAGVLEHVVAQHAQEAAMLRQRRSRLVLAPHVGLMQLARLDERIEAHLDGLAVAGPVGLERCKAELAQADPGAAVGEWFNLGVLALRARSPAILDELLALAGAASDVRRGLVSAFGWVTAEALQGVVRRLLGLPIPTARALALSACRMHRVDPGTALATALAGPDAEVRLAAAQAAGQLARLDLLPDLQAAMSDADTGVAFWAAWAACRLGDRQAALKALESAAQRDGPHADEALALYMEAAPAHQAHDLARHLSAGAQAQTQSDIAATRRLLHAMALLGDARFVPWLLERMQDPALARMAGQAFSWITGADLSALELERLDAGAESADDAEAAASPSLDADEDLPWPDAARCHAWWSHSASNTQGQGPRLFMGHASGADTARSVLQHGAQRQRAQAALMLAVQEPASLYFPVAAPAWRQRRWLSAA